MPSYSVRERSFMPSARFRLTAPTLLWACCLHGQSTNPLELLRQPTPPANERFAYGKDPLQFAEMRVPAGTGPFPVAIMVHGGCWSAKLSDLPEAVTSFELLPPNRFGTCQGRDCVMEY